MRRELGGPRRKSTRSVWGASWGILEEVLDNLSPDSAAELIVRVARRVDKADGDNQSLGPTLERVSELIHEFEFERARVEAAKGKVSRGT
jgi:hypothetical protein